MGSQSEHRSILIVNQYFPPDTSATARIFADLAATFQSAGYQTTVLCGRPSYRSTEGRRWKPLTVEGKGIAVERVGSTALPLRSVRARLVNYLSYLVLAAVRAFTRPRPDVVLSGSDPPLAVGVALLAARGRPVLYFLQDLHPEAAMSAGWISSGHLADGWNWLHRRAMQRCAAVVCLGDEMRKRLVLKGISPDRIAVVPNGAPPPVPTTDTELIRQLRGASPFTVVHAGNVGVAGAWEAIAEAQRLVGTETAEFVFVGDGARENDLRSWGLRVEPYESDVAAVMAAGDVQLVTQRPEMEGLLVPSKLYTALVHGCPILAAVPGASEVASTVRRWECGVVADPDDPSDIATKVRFMLEDPERLRQMGERARTAGQQYRRPEVFQPLVRLAESLVSRLA